MDLPMGTSASPTTCFEKSLASLESGIASVRLKSMAAWLTVDLTNGRDETANSTVDRPRMEEEAPHARTRGARTSTGQGVPRRALFQVSGDTVSCLDGFGLALGKLS